MCIPINISCADKHSGTSGEYLPVNVNSLTVLAIADDHVVSFEKQRPEWPFADMAVELMGIVDVNDFLCLRWIFCLDLGPIFLVVACNLV